MKTRCLGAGIVCMLPLLASVLTPPGVARACDAVSADYHTFAPGTPLLGLAGGMDGGVGGGAWTGTWQNASLPDTPTLGDPSQFAVDQNGKISVGVTGGESVAIQRSFNFDTSSWTSIDASAEFMEVTNNSDPFVTSIQFRDDSGTKLAEFGLKEQSGDSSAHFFAAIGSSSQSSTANVLANTYYNLFATLTAHQINPSTGQLGSVLSLWANPSFVDLSNPSTIVAQVWGPDVTSNSAKVGDRMVLYAQTQAPNTRKTWDDIAVSTDADRVASAKLTFKSVTDNVEPGFDEFPVKNGPQTSYSQAIDQSGFNLPNATVTVRSVTGASVVPVDDTTLIPAPIPTQENIGTLMRQEGIGAVGGLELEFDGLIHDGMDLKTYSYHAPQTNHDVWVDVSVSPDGINFTPAGRFLQGNQYDAATEFYAPLNTYTTDSYWLRYTPETPGDFVELNGFQVVPEPGTFALLAAGATMLAAYAWRRKSAARPCR